jgi:hypothetical protein
VIERWVADLGLLGEQIAGFPEERGLRIQHGPDDPGVKVSEIDGGVFAQELPSVSGCPADH